MAKLKCGSEVTLSGEGIDISMTGVFDGKLQTVKTGISPYGFVEKRHWSAISKHKYVTAVKAEGLKTSKGAEVVRFETRKPSEVGAIRIWCDGKGIPVYEADIPYVRRVFIDEVFDVEYWPDRVIWVDVEIDDSAGMPTQYGQFAFESIAASFDGKTVKYWNCRKDERGALEDFMAEVMEAGKTLMVGWNVDFDKQHITERLKVLEVQGADYIENYCFGYDLREVYRFQTENKGLSSYTLKEVAEHEGFKGKDRKKKVHDLTDEELKEYNVHDVELLLDLEHRAKKTPKLVETRCRLHEDVKLPMSMDSAYQIGDTEIVRRVRQLGKVSPVSQRRENANYKGAFVQKPLVGLVEKIAVIDVSGLYPTAQIELNVDVANYKGEVLPWLVKKYLKQKKDFAAAGDEAGKFMAKIKTNGIGYGLLGYGNFRYFDPAKAKMIVDRGKMELFLIRDYLEKMGMPVVYSDTDSCFVNYSKITNPEPLVDLINEKFTPYQVNLENVFKWVIFFEKRSGEGGAKKRYVGMDRNGELKIRGIELRRGDWCALSKQVLRKSILMAGEARCTEDELLDYWRVVKRNLYAGKYDDLLVITQRVQEKYEKPPKHYLAYKGAVEAGKIAKGVGELSYVVVPKGRIVAWTEGDKVEYDYGYYWNKQVMPPLQTLLDSVYRSGKQVTLD